MNNEIVKIQIIEILEDLCAEKVSDPSAQLLGDLSMDSLRMVMLLVMIEDRFEIELDESDMDPYKLITVNDVIDLVAKYSMEGNGDENG